ncbi:hypothetical protein [Paenibacillus sp. HJGM_3]|uniref:hypothetical protein n=1 Tax=Paenibacillus sp. HJGM_3 TaxID=3379816 RepID=UPI00385B6FC3
MDSEKRTLIVREIEQWRRSKLLPEQYCDFLLNLYMDDTVERERKVAGVSVQAIQSSRWHVWLLIFGAAAVIFFLALHFNSFPSPLQIGLLGAAVIGSYVLGIAASRKSPVLAYSLVGVGSAALLAAGVLMLRLAGKDDPGLFVAYVAFCCVIWIAIGILARMGLFQYCGWIGLLLVYAWLLQDQEASHSWVGAQLSWLPLCFLFGWFGWLLLRRKMSPGSILLLVAFTIWLLPEIYGFYIEGRMDPMFQASLTVKLLAAGAGLFATRKKWIEWVA